MDNPNISSLLRERPPKIAYFSMEIGLRNDLPTYSGGLGVLAGDTIKSAADLGLPLAAITLLYRKGYFRQHLDLDGNQSETPVEWNPADLLTELADVTVRVTIAGRKVALRPWFYPVKGATGGTIPVFFLDSDLPENHPDDRHLTWHLYGGDQRYRLAQEIILGIGGVRLLRELHIHTIQNYHMNEGHAALLTLELLRIHKRSIQETWDAEHVWDYHHVRYLCVFTTHTPVPAGHDRFAYELVDEMLRDDYVPREIIEKVAGKQELNMTQLALNLSRYANAVSKKHCEVSRRMFPDHDIKSVTNGVHSATWTTPEFQALYDRYIPDWRQDSFMLRNAIAIPDNEIVAAHQVAKEHLLTLIQERTGISYDPAVLTIGFARRAAAYKRADLVFHDLERLRHIARDIGKLQFVFAGKAHPRDLEGKELIKHIINAARALAGDIPVVYLEEYNMDLGLKVTTGVDLWLNTPDRPHEASGTSGMKAAHNGVPNFSVLDGWWIEGYIEGITGWAIGRKPDDSDLHVDESDDDAESLYEKLEQKIVPTFYGQRDRWIDTMKYAICFNASFFNTYRMILEYYSNIYFL
jgi:starch phosphorylase